MPAAVIALVNDLDLEIVSPDGHLYRGNRFSDGESHLLGPLGRLAGRTIGNRAGSECLHSGRDAASPVKDDV